MLIPLIRTIACAVIFSLLVPIQGQASSFEELSDTSSSIRSLIISKNRNSQLHPARVQKWLLALEPTVNPF